ncbi:RNA polymerase II degradation factor 1-like [Senna tora]|uniref:RNA polymerase II degradation factor 1-like n=1 Tax=Senna tora TaxID=362788 RepID=A0A834U3I2_9FABA|nr:RNA polymerase II degradation factor 1-like [Senna tora]
MGKKKVQKTKELSVAIAEASSAGEKVQQVEQSQPRKRGRPRKMVEKTEEREEKQEETIIEGSSFKKGKSSESEQHDVEKQEGSSACTSTSTRFTNDPKAEPSRSRARRKSKPRKST